MNTPLRRVAYACLALFGILLLQANYLQAYKASAYLDDPRNGRVLLRTYDRERGPITVGNGQERQAIAMSKETTDTLKYLRTYANGPLYAPVTGFYSLVYGASGIERNEDRVLSGEDDRLFVRRFSDAITGRAPQGGSIALTINPKAQQAAFQALAGRRGAAVALDPRTGAILALVSSPSYDPSLLSSHDPAKIAMAYKALQNDPANPMLDRALNQTYPPGSTFKLITAAAALSAGTYTPQTRIASPTVLALPQTNQPLRNFGGESCGDGKTTTLADALRISCNTAFGQLGLVLGATAVRKQAAAFGFGETDLFVPQRVSRSSYPDTLSPPQLAQAAIGQYDVRVTPLQMAMVAAGIANQGRLMTPYLVNEVQAPDFSRLDLAQPKPYRETTTPQVAAELTAMMELVVQSGTGTAAQIPGIRVAGKTGTAQHAVGAAPHAWFIGFAPAQDPQIAVAVVVEDGGLAGSEATGGQVAAPIAKAMFEAVLR